MPHPDRRLQRAAERLDRAAHIKPIVDYEICNALAVCDTQQTNETGITAQGTINDPVLNAVVRRGHILDRSNAVDRAVVAVEAAVNELGAVLHQSQEHKPAAAKDEPVCYVADCTAIVEHYTVDNGKTTRYRSEGLCSSHRLKVEREQRQREDVA